MGRYRRWKRRKRKLISTDQIVIFLARVRQGKTFGPGRIFRASAGTVNQRNADRYADKPVRHHLALDELKKLSGAKLNVDCVNILMQQTQAVEMIQSQFRDESC